MRQSEPIDRADRRANAAVRVLVFIVNLDGLLFVVVRHGSLYGLEIISRVLVLVLVLVTPQMTGSFPLQLQHSTESAEQKFFQLGNALNKTMHLKLQSNKLQQATMGPDAK